MKLTIKGELPTTNDIIAAMNTQNRQVYARMKRENTWLVKMESRNLPPVEKADFTFTWYCKNRRRDPDNISGGIKFIFDGLVEAGVIENDGWKQIGSITNHFEVDRYNPRVEVKINEV